MKTIQLSDNSTYDSFWGMSGEHNIVKLSVKVSKEFNSADVIEAVALKYNKERIPIKNLIVDNENCVDIELSENLTFTDSERIETLAVQITAYVYDENGKKYLIAKTPTYTGRILPSIPVGGLPVEYQENLSLVSELIFKTIEFLKSFHEHQNSNTLSKFHCETAQGEGDAFHITTELYPNLVKFNGRYLREVDHGRVIQSVHKVTKDGKSCLRMTFDRVTPSFNLSPDDPNGENEHYDFVDFPVIDIEQKEDSDNNLVLNGGQLDLGVGNYAPMPKMSVSAGELNILNANTAYVFGECSALNIMLADGAENKLNEYIFSFISGETPTVLTLPSDIVWANELTVEANKRYEISIVGNVALWSATNIEVMA